MQLHIPGKKWNYIYYHFVFISPRKFVILIIMLIWSIMFHLSSCISTKFLSRTCAPHWVWRYRQWGADLWLKTEIFMFFPVPQALMQFWTLAHTPQCRTVYDVHCNKQKNWSVMDEEDVGYVVAAGCWIRMEGVWEVQPRAYLERWRKRSSVRMAGAS